MISWKGEHITSLDFVESANRYGSTFWDFHRADLHNCLYQRAVELGAKIHTNSRVDDIEYEDSPAQATVILADGKRYTGDLVVGADGIVSRTRECFLERNDPPTPTGDLAYRVLLDLREVQLEEDVQKMLEKTEVNYWMGPGAHAVCYMLRNRTYLNSEIVKSLDFLLYSHLGSGPSRT
jgi:salicylate hydroxylase